MAIPSLAAWLHALSVGDVQIAHAGVGHHPTDARAEAWPHRSALHLAVTCSHLPLLRSLVRTAQEQGVSLDLDDRHHQTPLALAIETQNDGAVLALLEAGASPAAAGFWPRLVRTGNRPWFQTWIQPDRLTAFPVLRTILNAPARFSKAQWAPFPTPLPGDRATALRVAMEADEPKPLVRALLALGADPQVPANGEADGPPFWVSASPERWAMLHGMGVNLEGPTARTLLHELVSRPLDPGTEAKAVRGVRWLVRHFPAWLRQPDDTGLTPLDVAVVQHAGPLVEALLDAGAPWHEAHGSAWTRLLAQPATAFTPAQRDRWAQQAASQTQADRIVEQAHRLSPPDPRSGLSLRRSRA